MRPSLRGLTYDLEFELAVGCRSGHYLSICGGFLPPAHSKPGGRRRRQGRRYQRRDTGTATADSSSRHCSTPLARRLRRRPHRRRTYGIRRHDRAVRALSVHPRIRYDLTGRLALPPLTWDIVSADAGFSLAPNGRQREERPDQTRVNQAARRPWFPHLPPDARWITSPAARAEIPPLLVENPRATKGRRRNPKAPAAAFSSRFSNTRCGSSPGRWSVSRRGGNLGGSADKKLNLTAGQQFTALSPPTADSHTAGVHT